MRKTADKAPRRHLPPIAHRLSLRPRTAAVTLMELLLVLSILAILASITLVIGRSITERSKVSQARAEMAVLAAALEQYKQQYGDYPWTPAAAPTGVTSPKWDGGAVLFNALCGNLGPMSAEALPAKGRTFVDVSRFTLDSTDETDLPEVDSTDLKVNWFNDPWGKWYYYRYRQSASDTTWASKGFLLYSHGPDLACNVGAVDEPTTPFRTGLLENFPAGSDEINRDNIYYGRD